MWIAEPLRSLEMFETVINFERSRPTKEFTFNSLTFVVLLNLQLSSQSQGKPFYTPSVCRHLKTMRAALDEILSMLDNVSNFELSEAITKILN